ncbi:MAG: septum formation initiator family protein [Alphaproteobacteria bacterium]|nr:septum formation initiator family protein [Alphaproteobacteria bacterium]
MTPHRTWQVGLSIAGACIVGYFLYHTIEGERGWVAQMRLQNEIFDARENLLRLKRERHALERRVQRMKPEQLDPDLLDEQARKTLGYSKPNEIVILTPAPPDDSDPGN